MTRHKLSTCTRHPTKPITGFCAACLRERLAGIDPDTHLETPITHLATELRRSKSYSSTSNPNSSTATATSATATTTTTTSAEPRRKSCDVRNHSTLSDLFGFYDKTSGFLKKSTVSELGFGRQNGKFEGTVGNDLRFEMGFDGSDENGEFRTMKEFIDLEWEQKRSSFDLREKLASVFSKKVLKWQVKEKNKEKERENKQCMIDGFVKKEGYFLRKFRETQSEVGEYGGLGRRSCDTDPRLSVDVARISVDDSRYCFDEPRASWDGYLIGKSFPPLRPLVSVVEDVNFQRGNADDDGEDNVGLDKVGGECSPGGTEQTRDYYSDRRTRRRSFDWSVSHRRMSLGDDELKLMSNAKVSPETVGLFHGAKLLVTEKELRDSNWYSLKDCHAEGVVGSMSKDVGSVDGGVSKKGFKFKKSQRWRSLLNIWGMMQRRSSESKCRDDEISAEGNVVDEPVGQSWQKLDVAANGEVNRNVSQKLLRSYTVSAKDSSRMACTSMNGVEIKDNIAKKRDDLVLQRNPSVRYSPNHLDNGLLRFYLTPLRSYGRNKPGVSRLKHSNSIARNVL